MATFIPTRKPNLYLVDPEEEEPRKKRFNPRIAASGQLVILGDPPRAGTSVPALTVIGGRGDLRMFISGVDRQTFTLIFGAGHTLQQVRIDSQTIGRWSCAFDLYDPAGGYVPALRSTVVLVEGGYRQFAGCIDSIDVDLVEGETTNPIVVYHCIANDKSGILDHRVVLTSPGYDARMDVAALIRDLWTNSGATNPTLDQEGITLNNVPASLGVLTSFLPTNLPYVRTVLDAAMKQIGGVWFVDSDGDLHAQLLPDIGVCPFSLVANSPTFSKNFRKAHMTTSLLEFATKVYAVSDRTVVPPVGSGGTTDVSVTETYTLPQPAAASRGFLYDAIITDFPISSIVTLKVNNILQPTYLGTQTPNISFRHTWWYFADTPYITGPNIQGLNPFPDPAVTSPDPSPGDTVQITYLTPQRQAAQKTGDILAPAAGTCGTGVIEVVEQVKGITSTADLAAIANAAKVYRNVIPKTLSVEIDTPGAAVGQRISVDIPALDLAATTLMITALNGVALEGDLGQGTHFRWTLIATNTQDYGNSIKWFERLFQRTDNATAVPRFEDAKFALGNGSSISAGFPALNPYPVQNTGPVILIYAVAGTAPTGQDLIIEFLSDAQGVIGSITIPDGVTALQTSTITASSPAPYYLFALDLVRVSIAYSNIGANPVPAQNVSAGLHIQY